MVAQHTPGPWAVLKQKARRVTASGVIICNAVLRNRGGPKHKTELKDEHEAEANAQLIAAAPEALVALIELEHRFGHVKCLPIDMARAAIAKATGAAPAARGEAICKGDVRLGTGCGNCARCRAWEDAFEGEDRA